MPQSVQVSEVIVRRLLLPFLLLLSALNVCGSVLPGFSIRALGTTSGFVTSLAADSKGTIYYTTQDGGLFRFERSETTGTFQSTLLARVNTVAISDSGLLGMALRDDSTAAVHYTIPNNNPNRFGDVLADVVSWVDLRSGQETVLHTFACDLDVPARGESAEHHGGNPSIGPNGSVFVGIGDYNIGLLVTIPGWNAGRIFQILPDGSAREFAKGFRNPYDLSWDSEGQRLIAPDNGPSRAANVPPDIPDDEINVIHFGDDAGWPDTYGNRPPVAGATPPLYVFPMVIAPTGIVHLGGRNSILHRGYLLGGFSTKAIYYIPDIDARPLPPPIEILRAGPSVTIDLAESGTGEIFFATPKTIYKLEVPQRGDCNGDGLVNTDDLTALMAQLSAGSRTLPSVLTTTPPGTFGCDVDGDGLITSADVTALFARLHPRNRSVRAH